MNVCKMTEDTLSAFNFQKLGSDNFIEWKFSMQMYLTAKSLWEIVTGDETVAETASEEEKLKFKKRHNLAFSAIGLGVKKDLQIYVRNCKTAKDAWDALGSRFQKKGLVTKIELRQKLYGTSLPSGGDMIAHVNRIKSISEQLAAVDDAVDEKDLYMILIASWPREYYNLVTNLETVDEAKLSWSYVRDRCIAEYERRSSGEGSRDDDALNAWSNGRGRGRARGRGRGGKEKRSCHNCKEKGHLIRNCPKIEKGKDDDASVAVEDGQFDDMYALNAEEADDLGESDDTAQMTDDTPGTVDSRNNENDMPIIREAQELSPIVIELSPDDDKTDMECDDNSAAANIDDEDDALLVSPNDDAIRTLQRGPCAKDGHWTLDSGCSRHMTPVKTEFTRYLKFDKPVSVNLADKSKIFGYGIGDVQIKLFDGSTFVPVVIKNVLYVPKLHRKLLSISDITVGGGEKWLFLANVVRYQFF